MVSGQLATEACRNDVLGYGVVTDWWAKGTEPTVSCQMHTTQVICSDSKMPASSYCPHPVQAGVITIPSGHPLYNLLAQPQYKDVIEQYLGSSAAYSNTVCTMHNEYYQGPEPSGQNPDDPQSNAEARQVLAMAESMLGTLDPTSPKYQAVQNAADYLRMLLNSGGSQEDILTAMQTLTMAMGGIY